MNAFLRFDGSELWHVAGWTMLHFLWLGTLVALVAGVCRLLLRRASANVRYVAALACLVIVASLPIGIAAWLAAQTPSVSVDPSRAAANSPAQVQGIGQTVELSGHELSYPTDSVPPISGSAREPTGAAAQPAPMAAPTRPAFAAPAFAGAILEFCARYLPWLWIIGTPLTFALLATGVVGAERLRRTSLVVDDGPVANVCKRLVTSLRIGRRVTVAVCERIAAPVLVGILRPVILLPPAALTGWSPDEIEMVLLHELAHVRRWDNLVNLVQRLVESLLFFHPAVWWISAWVRREREACCDSVVVGRTNRPHAYAEMLVALAAQMPRSVLFHPAATSAMAAGPLRSRIRRILQLEDDPMLVSAKSLAVVMSGLLLAATLVVLNLPTEGQAEEAAAEGSESELAIEKGQQLEMETADGAHILAESQDGRLRVQVRKRQTGKFPSLEEQKLADLAWKRLGLELEPIGDEDLRRVRAFGYDGGVKVTGYQFGRYGVGEQGILSNDILVGLHAWPSTSLQAVADVLNRDDLGELNPLKYYVVRRLDPGGDFGGGGMNESSDQTRDIVLTGRIVAGPLPTVSGPVSPVGSSMEIIPMAPKAMDLPQGAFESQRLELSRSQHQAEARIAEAAKRLGELRGQQALMEQQLAELQAEGTADLPDARKHELAAQTVQLRQQIAALREEAAKQTRAIQKQTKALADLKSEGAAKHSQYLIKQQRLKDPQSLDDELNFDLFTQNRINPAEPAAQAEPGVSQVPGQAPSAPAVAPEAQPVWQASPSLPYAVRFEQGASHFLDGDQIKVLEVRGTAETFRPGNFYWIRGTYTLGSHDRAQLAAYTTAKDAADGMSKTWAIQTIDVDRGSGTFELFLPMSYRGWPHVSYYPADGGNGFGGTYFGTGESVLKKWSEVYGPTDHSTPTSDEDLFGDAQRSQTGAGPPNKQAAYEDFQQPHAGPVAFQSAKSDLRYDGKTFDQWRDLWRNELSTLTRLQAVNALAAFGASGYGREAAKAIVEVAEQYDWTSTYNPEIRPLLNACVTAFGASLEGESEGTVAHKIAPAEALPVLLEAARSENRQQKLFVTYVLPRFFKVDDYQAVELMLELSRDEDDYVRSFAFRRLPGVISKPPARYRQLNEAVISRIREVLTEGDAFSEAAAIPRLIHYEIRSDGQIDRDKSSLYYLPELFPKLFSENVLVRRTARRAIQYIQPKEAPEVVNKLLQVLQDEARRADHIEAIRALAAMGLKAEPARPALEKILQATDDRFVSTAVALDGLNSEEIDVDTLFERKGRIASFTSPSDVWNAINSERPELFPYGPEVPY